MPKPEPVTAVAFIGLGRMGLPMAGKLVSAGYRVFATDLSEEACAAFTRGGGEAKDSARTAAAGARVLITMLPDGRAVRDALLGSGRAASALDPGALVIDMSSSAPFSTRTLGDELEAMQIALVDAPVSGGVQRAITGELAIMAGGAPADVERARPLLNAMGSTIIPTGLLGSGHAMKALNNYVSASGLAAACEAVLVGSQFGLEPQTIVDVLNASTGKNNSTEKKMTPFVLSEAFNAGFSLKLMAKDIGAASKMAERMGLQLPGITGAAALWGMAEADLGGQADHTAIYTYLQKLGKQSAPSQQTPAVLGEAND